FAYRDPPPTRNPRNLDHTPGGSSSGSAAAVAAGVVPFALGTQTLGSGVRPASYCGSKGVKPAYGLVSLAGVLPFRPSLDTLGFFTRTPADMLALWEALGHPGGSDEDLEIRGDDDLRPMLAKLADAAVAVMTYEAARVHEQRFVEFGDRLGRLAVLVR